MAKVAICDNASPSTNPQDTSSNGRRLVAKEHVRRDDVLMSIPANLIMAVSSDRNSEVPQTFSCLEFLLDDSEGAYFWEDAPWDIRLAVLLLDHHLAAQHSPWYPYIASLPRRPQSVICALADPIRAPIARTQLQALDLLDTADSYAAYVLAQYNSFNKAVRVKNTPDTAAQSAGCGVDPQLFCWAAAIAQSRAFAVPTLHSTADNAFADTSSIPQHFALFPALDCGNHSAHARSELRYDENSHSYTVISRKAFDENHQVYLNYGVRTPAELAVFYGFVEGFSSNSIAAVGPEIVWDAQETCSFNQDKKTDLLQLLDIAHDDDTFQISLHQVDPRLMHALRICVADDDAQLAKLGDMNEPNLYKPVALDNELRAWKTLSAHLERLVQVSAVAPQFLGELDALANDGKQPDERPPFSAAFDWGGQDNDRAEALYIYERNRVFQVTMKRLETFSKMSEKLGRVIDPALLTKPTTTILGHRRARKGAFIKH